MKNILCYGDSNTFGTHPAGGRHPRQVRWPGRLQALLGEDYYVIEEGLGGRTAVWEDPLEPNRCGIDYLPVALRSHKPLDLVIVMLGTNDCKSHFCATERIIARGVGNVCRLIRQYDYGDAYPVPKILLVSPIHIGTDLERCPYECFDEASLEKAKKLAPLLEAVARAQDCLFLDASRFAKPSETDQLHMDAEDHLRLADAIAAAVKGYFEK